MVGPGNPTGMSFNPPGSGGGSRGGFGGGGSRADGIVMGVCFTLMIGIPTGGFIWNGISTSRNIENQKKLVSHKLVDSVSLNKLYDFEKNAINSVKEDSLIKINLDKIKFINEIPLSHDFTARDKHKLLVKQIYENNFSLYNNVVKIIDGDGNLSKYVREELSSTSKSKMFEARDYFLKFVNTDKTYKSDSKIYKIANIALNSGKYKDSIFYKALVTNRSIEHQKKELKKIIEKKEVKVIKEKKFNNSRDTGKLNKGFKRPNIR